PFVGEIRASCGLHGPVASKFEVGLLARALVPPAPPDLGSVDVGPGATAAEVAVASLRQHLAGFLEQEPGTRLGEDPEHVPDMRVATRRMRAAMSLFAEWLPARFASFRRELKWVAGALGDVRDLDVQLE